MTQLYASIAIGTTASVLALLLLLVRAEVNGRRPLLALTRRWVASGAGTSVPVLALLSGIAAASFAQTPADGAFGQGSAVASLPHESVSDDGDVRQLKAYAATLDAKSATALPDVETMIAKLLARLEKEPSDVKGWKMLGWSYLNMERAEEATKAYETALKLDPSDTEIKKALAAVQTARSAAPQTPTSNPTKQ